MLQWTPACIFASTGNTLCAPSNVPNAGEIRQLCSLHLTSPPRQALVDGETVIAQKQQSEQQSINPQAGVQAQVLPQQMQSLPGGQGIQAGMAGRAGLMVQPVQQQQAQLQQTVQQQQQEQITQQYHQQQLFRQVQQQQAGVVQQDLSTAAAVDPSIDDELHSEYESVPETTNFQPVARRLLFGPSATQRLREIGRMNGAIWQPISHSEYILKACVADRWPVAA